MASRAAILRAARAGSPGAGQPALAPQGSGSPWIGQLPSYAMEPGPNYSYAYGPFLPRPPETFTQGAFGPLSPILPVPVDTPGPGLPRAQPRRWQPYVGYNLPVGEPGNEGYKLASFSTLKTLSETYSILRTCLEIRKNEIRALDWDILPTPEAARQYQGDKKAMREFAERKAKAKRFFRRPDPNYYTFESFLDAMMDQVFTIDALSLYQCPKKARGLGRGLLGSDLDCLWLINGASIRPLMGLHGEVPVPPAPGYQQYEFGVPRADLTMMEAGLDLNGEEGRLLAEVRGDQLMYYPYLQRVDSPYGFSLVEQALIPIMTGLRRQAMQLDYFNESSVPRVWLSPGDNSLTPNQIRELQDAINAVAGDVAWAFKVMVVPPNSKIIPQKDMAIVDDSDNWIATEVAMVANISPVELGLIPKVSSVASPFAAREMAQASRSIHERTSTKPTLMYASSAFDFILQQVCRQEDMRFVFNGMEETQDASASIDMGVKAVQSGIKSIDEVREDLHLTPWQLPETMNPVVFTQMGPVPLDGLLRQAVTGDQSSPQAQYAVQALQHQAAAAGQAPRKALPAGTSGQGRMNGPVTQRQARRGGALAPAHAMAEGSPGHSGASNPGRRGASNAAKAAAAELEALERHLNRGMPVSEWVPEHVPGHVMAMIAEDLGKGLSAGYAVKMAAKAMPQQETFTGQQEAESERIRALEQEYAREIGAALSAAIAAARLLIAAWIAGTLAVTAAVLASMILGLVRDHLGPVLDRLWRDAWAEGEQAAGGTAPEDLDAFLATWGQQWLQVISGTGEDGIIAAVRDSLAAGDPDAAGNALGGILNPDGRAETIAVSEITRAWNAAVLAVLSKLGIGWVRWQTRNDDKVCPVCKANQKASPLPVNSVFPGRKARPPQHPNCVIGSTRVSAPSLVVAGDVPVRLPGHLESAVPVREGGFSAATAVAVAERDFGRRNIRAVTDREYVGDVIVIRTAFGHELTVTPNHPVATRSGWVPAAELTVGSYVLSSTSPEWVMDSVNPDEDHVPPSIKEVAQSLPVAFGAVPLAAEDFHGDGEGSEVCVIRADGLLVDRDYAVVAEHVCKHLLRWGDVASGGTLSLDSQGLGEKELLGFGSASDGRVGRAGESGTLSRGGLSHPGVHGLAAPAWGDTRLDEPVADDLPADSGGFCERLLALSAEIALDQVVDIKRDVVATHVYNLETAEGWYIGNGIVTHNCRCRLLPSLPPKASGKSRKVLRREVGLNGQETWTEWEPQPDTAGGRIFYPHRADGAEYTGSVPGAVTGGEPPRWDGSEPDPVTERAPAADDDAAYGEAEGLGARPGTYWPAPYMDGWWPSPHGHGTGQPPSSSPGSQTGRPPNAAGKTARVSAPLKGKAVPARVVYDQMRDNFPDKAIRWILGATWILADVPHDMIDYADEDKWAASHQPGHVRQFIRAYEAGERVRPPVMVDEPGHQHLVVVDGHHRTLARKKMGKPAVRAFVGTVSRRGGPALRTYQHQFHSGDDPRNKSFTAGNTGTGDAAGLVPLAVQGQRAGPYVAGLAVRAADTGRVLMLQRAVSDTDPAAGLWEIPGGHADTGEPLLGAAVREWSEETGRELPHGEITGRWESSDGIYQGFVLTIPREGALDLGAPREVANPDGDAFEAVAWWDPALTRHNPAVRPELRADYQLLAAALAGASKSAETPYLSAHHAPIGHEGVWHSKHPPLQLPAYIQNIRNALMREGMDEREAHAMAVAAIERWRKGDLKWGPHRHVSPEVRRASQEAYEQWMQERASHP